VTSLKALINSAASGEQLIVTGPHYDWIERLETDKVPSPKAVAHAIRAYLRFYKRPRAGRFSASAMGGCRRATVFGYANAPQVKTETAGEEIFDHGTVSHLRWQMEGLTMGYMRAAEVWVEDKDLRVGGSMDADLENGDVFELKSCAPSVYRRVVEEAQWPKAENIAQADTYMLLRDAPYVSLVYEDRSYGDFHEFRVARDARRERNILRELRTLNRYVEEDDLPPMLDDCELRLGKAYRQCFFRKICPKVHTVSEAQEAGRKQNTEDSGLQVAPGEDVPEWVAHVLKVLDAEVPHG
jgi:hypothetical protein